MCSQTLLKCPMFECQMLKFHFQPALMPNAQMLACQMLKYQTSNAQMVKCQMLKCPNAQVLQIKCTYAVSNGQNAPNNCCRVLVCHTVLGSVTLQFVYLFFYLFVCPSIHVQNVFICVSIHVQNSTFHIYLSCAKFHVVSHFFLCLSFVVSVVIYISAGVPRKSNLSKRCA